MCNKNIEPRVDWVGDFTWDGYFLRKHIKTVIPEYDVNEPRTWPLIREVIATGNRADHSKTTVPPEYLAYDQTLIKSFKRLQGSRSKPSRMSQHLKNVFLYYPFNYDRHGQPRKHPHMTPDELEEWKKQVSRAVPTMEQKANAKNMTTNDHANDETTQDVSPEAAMDEIMKMLDDVDTDTDMVPYARVVDLEEELQKTKKQVSEANKRADTAEEAKATMDESYKTACELYSMQIKGKMSELREHWVKLLSQERTNLGNAKVLLMLKKEAMDEEKTRADAAERSVEALKVDLAGCSNDLKKSKNEFKELQTVVQQSNKDTWAAKQKAEAVEQQIFKILEGMKKKQHGAGSQKSESCGSNMRE